jgi:hypothetical protein
MSTMNAKDKAIAWALTLCAAMAMGAALSAPADAETSSNGYKMARFKVEVKGWQTTVLQHTHAAENNCDISDSSSGSEKVNFRTTKPIVITASYFPGLENPEFFSGKQLAIPTKAVVKRSYTPRITMPAVPCEDNGGGVEQTYQPDCGTKTVSPYWVKLEYAEKLARDKLLLTTYSDDGDPFERCPGAASHSFPFLTVYDSKAKLIGAELSQKELFDPEFRKWTSIVRGSVKETYTDSWSKTTIHWEVSFTRLKDKAPKSA